MTMQRWQMVQMPGDRQRVRIGTFLFIVLLTGALFTMGRSMVRHHFFDGGTQIQQYERAESDTPNEAP